MENAPTPTARFPCAIRYMRLYGPKRQYNQTDLLRVLGPEDVGVQDL